MADVPEFAVQLPMRCCQLLGSRPRAYCAEWGNWFRPGNYLFADAFFCDRHRAPTDTRIPDTFVYRRVRVMCDITIAAVSLIPGEAQNEAVTVLQTAVARAGGVLNLHGVTSHVGRYGPAPARPKAKSGRGRGL